MHWTGAASSRATEWSAHWLGGVVSCARAAAVAHRVRMRPSLRPILGAPHTQRVMNTHAAAARRTRVVQARGDAVRLLDLAVRVLHKVTEKGRMNRVCAYGWGWGAARRLLKQHSPHATHSIRPKQPPTSTPTPHPPPILSSARTCSKYVIVPCSTPGVPAVRVAACFGVSTPDPPASTPICARDELRRWLKRDGWTGGAECGAAIRVHTRRGFAGVGMHDVGQRSTTAWASNATTRGGTRVASGPHFCARPRQPAHITP